MGPIERSGYWDSTGRLIHPMARPKPAIAQRKSDPSSTQIIVLGRVVAWRASFVVTSTFFGIVSPPEGGRDRNDKATPVGKGRAKQVMVTPRPVTSSPLEPEKPRAARTGLLHARNLHRTTSAQTRFKKGQPCRRIFSPFVMQTAP